MRGGSDSILAARARDELTLAIGAFAIHGGGTVRAESAFVRANEGGAIVGKFGAAFFAADAHFEGHFLSPFWSF